MSKKQMSALVKAEKPMINFEDVIVTSPTPRIVTRSYSIDSSSKNLKKSAENTVST